MCLHKLLALFSYTTAGSHYMLYASLLYCCIAEETLVQRLLKADRILQNVSDSIKEIFYESTGINIDLLLSFVQY